MNFETLKMTALINAFSVFKIPLLAFVRPKVVKLSSNESVVKIGLGWSTKNHLGSMYFGALAMGAELSIAIKLVEFIKLNKAPVSFVFKDFNANFLLRAESDVFFVCEQAADIVKLAEDAIKSKVRMEKMFEGFAYSGTDRDKIVMKYQLTLSLKNRN